MEVDSHHIYNVLADLSFPMQHVSKEVVSNDTVYILQMWLTVYTTFIIPHFLLNNDLLIYLFFFFYFLKPLPYKFLISVNLGPAILINDANGGFILS